MIYLLSGLHAARFEDNLRRTLTALTSDDVHAVVVMQNGCTLPDMPGLTMLHSESGLLPFLHTGMSWLRNNTEPGDWFARVDCDDLYSAEYVEGLRSAKESGAVWSGIPSPYMRRGDGQVVWCRLCDSKWEGGLGGTLAGSIHKAAPWRFLPGQTFGTDTSFREDMVGSRFAPRAPVGFALQRHPDHLHTYPIPTDVLIHAWPVIPYLQPGPAEEAIRRPPVLDSPIEQDVELACSIRHYLTN